MRFFSLTAIPACAGPARARPNGRRAFALASAAPRVCFRSRLFLGFASDLYRSRLFLPSAGPARARPVRAAAIRPCLGCASVAGVMLNNFSVYHRLPRYARLAIEARPLGRARAGPAQRE